MTRIFLLDGHPDPSPERFCAALADAYAAGARRSGHEVRRFDLGAMDFPLLRTKEDFESAPIADDAARVQDALKWAEHIVVIHPIWIGSQPALLRALFEQVFRRGFVLTQPYDKSPKKILKGRSAHVVTTLGMSAFAYRWLFGAQGVRGLTKGLLRAAGVKPVRRTLIGSAEEMSDRRRRAVLRRMQEAGASAR